MQRRAAAVYFALFLVIGAGAFGFIQVGMTEPTVQFQDAPEYGPDDTITVDGRTHTVANITTVGGSGEGGGHGGGGGGEELSANLTWVNESARETATLANGSTTTYEGVDYNVLVDNASGQLTLSAVQNVSAILEADPAVEDEPLTQNGTQYVRYVDNGTIQPLSEYLPEPERVSFAVGDDYRYPAESGNVTATVSAVTAEEATLTWTSPQTNRIQLSEGGNVTLNGQQHFVHFPSEPGDESPQVQVLPVDSYYDSYQTQLAEIDYFQERTNGVWGVVILSFLAGIILLGTAYLPVK